LGSLKKILIVITLLVFNTENVHSIIIDVRTQEEWDNGYIEDAIHIPLSIISEDIDKFVKSYDEKILLYCRSGNRSGKARNILEKLGYSNASNLGGISDISKSKGLKIIKK
tara:strand:+ start:415 stop:747 length:333 start_codon:yes stop_codon:yes gene_type:complete